MGKIRIRKVKVLAREILSNLGGSAAMDFESNKVLVGRVLAGRVSKKMRNKIAGYLTSLMKKSVQKTEETEGKE